MHSSLVQQLDNFNFTSSRFIVRTFKWLEDLSLRSADGIITVCPDLAELVESQTGLAGKHLLIENSRFDPIQLTGTPPGSPSSTLPFELRGPLVAYAGTLEAYQGLELVNRQLSCAC
jgi:hypothetical protein